MGKVTKVIAEMAKIENLNEAHVFELCDQFELNYIEEARIMKMYYDAMGKEYSTIITKILKEPVQIPTVDVETKRYMLTKGFGA
jgi:hypothetical protein